MRKSAAYLENIPIGFVSTRFVGTDGVSLETEKWASVLESLGHRCFYFCGESDRPPDVTRTVPEAHFKHPDIQAINEAAFEKRRRPPSITRRILEIKDYLKDHLAAFVNEFDLRLLIVENALAIPMNLPLGLAITEYVAETGFPVIAHHHDFFWERKRFLVNCVWDYLNMAFPPHLPSIHHVVINSSGGNQLSLRTGISSLLIPNVMDFEHGPAPANGYASEVRRSLGLQENERMVLQPTRVVQRKGIEHAIELLSRLDLPVVLVISHASGDEGYSYERYLKEYARRLGVRTLFISDIIKERRGQTPDGRNIYTLRDVYPYADLVTYPSELEGFGNAFLEAVFYRKPIVVNNYSIFAIDIAPKGFEVITFDGFITDQTVQRARRVLTDPDLARRMTEKNYQLGRRYYSYSLLKRRLETLITDCFGE
jgi:glycosyltransferase involved in cell wall biosynthesis